MSTATTADGVATADDWKLADLQYTDERGYAINTASFGAGDWQITAADYDAGDDDQLGL